MTIIKCRLVTAEIRCGCAVYRYYHIDIVCAQNNRRS